MNAGRYEPWTVPEALSIRDGNGEIVMLTLGADMNGVPEDARLDYEILAWSESGATYSVAHGSIGTFIPRENTRKHKVDRERWTYDHGYANSVWPAFEEIIKTPIRVKGENGERDMEILACGLDTGHYTAQAYQFVDSQDLLFFGLKGRAPDEFRKQGVDTPVFRQARERAKLYLVEVNQIKDELADYMDLNWDEANGVDQPAGFMNFPFPSKDMYSMRDFFSHFEAEHRVLKKDSHGKIVGSLWAKKKATLQNHLFDCRVYNMAVKEILQYRILSEEKIPFKEQSWQAFCQYILG
jgi:phage terminase large subunit GpA-like protein